YSQSSNGLLKGGSTSTSEQGRKLLAPDEIMRMDNDKNQLVFVQSGNPIMAKKIRWYKEPYFKKRAFAIHAPIFSDTCTAIRDYKQLFAIHAAEVADIKERLEKVNQARMDSEAAESGANATNADENPAEKADAEAGNAPKSVVDNHSAGNQTEKGTDKAVENQAAESLEAVTEDSGKEDEQIEHAENTAEGDIQQQSEDVEPEKEKDHTAEPGDIDKRQSQQSDIPRSWPAGEEEVIRYDDEPVNNDPEFRFCLDNIKQEGSGEHGTSA
ncbi:MAG: type IV secretory system conjugative DNA transfer family protein, partial [Selenomonadaceae bacterium]|nr:type IV secretory system conjugative DNA transfer family protein [Selenomonadaceae bacterium]